MSNHLPLTIFDPLTFGKYAGTLAGTVAEEDPSYILWLDEKTDVPLSEELVAYAQENL